MVTILSVQTTKTSQDTERIFRKFLEPSEKPEVIHTDNSLEFGKSCEDLSWNHRTSTRHRSETSGIAERALRGKKEGTSAVLLQSGLDEKCRQDVMVADIAELEHMDASELHARWLNAKEVLTLQNGAFPIADGTVKLSGRDLNPGHKIIFEEN